MRCRSRSSRTPTINTATLPSFAAIHLCPAPIICVKYWSTVVSLLFEVNHPALALRIQQVAVNVKGHGGCAVAQALADQLDRGAPGQEQRAVGVAGCRCVARHG